MSVMRSICGTSRASWIPTSHNHAGFPDGINGLPPGLQKAANIHVKADTPEQEFVQKRETRDKTLAVPRLIYPSVQVNIRGGQLPKEQANGVSYIKIPLTLK